MITTEAGCNAAKDWVLQNAQAKLKIETDANYPRGCYLHDTSKDHGVFIFNDHPSSKGNALSRTICMLKTDQKAESAETSEKAQVDKKAADVASADDEESVRHRDRHASRHSKHNSRHRSKHGEEHMQLTDAFGKQYTHKSVKHAASLRGDPSDNQTARHSDAPTKSAAEDNATDTDVQSEYKSVKHLRKHERAADKATDKAAEEKDDKPSHSSHSSHSKKHEPKTAHAKSDEKLARKHDRAAE